MKEFTFLNNYFQSFFLLVIEPIFIFVMSYAAYLSAEIFHFSGIMA